MNGVVTLDEIDGKGLFVHLKSSTYNNLKIKIKELGLVNTSKKIKCSDRIIYHWLNDGALIRYDILKDLCKLFEIKDIEKQIKYVRGKDGGQIKNPKLPFNFTTISGVRFIASILGDGTLAKDYETCYYNSNTELVNGFIKDSKNIFGDVDIAVRKKSDNLTVNIVSLPKLCGKVLVKTGIKNGRKVSLNQKVPDFIFDLSETEKWHFLSQIFDDEGTVNLKAKYIRVKLAVESRHKEFYLIKDLARLFSLLGVRVAVYNAGSYDSKTGFERTQWSIQINGSIKLNTIYKNFKLRHKPKARKLNKLLKSFQLIMFPRKEFQKIYLEEMQKIQREKGFFTVLDLSKGIDRNRGHIRNTVHKFNSLGLIECIEPYSSGNAHNFAKYRVVR